LSEEFTPEEIKDIKKSIEDLKHGRFKKFHTVKELIADLDTDEQKDKA